MLDFLKQDYGRRAGHEDRQVAVDEAPTGVMSGIASGTRVATARGWQRIDDVATGDRVLTFDNGLRPVRSIRRMPLWQGHGACPRRFRPLHVPAGVLDNREPMTVLPRQAIMVESDAAEDMTGDPFALVRAEDLEGICGIERIEMRRPIEVFVLEFDEDEIVFTAEGALCVCAAGGDMIARLFGGSDGAEYRLLSEDSDGALLEEIRFEICEAWIEKMPAAAIAETARVA
ncbi:Hint domain-containing protein [Oceanicola sp. 22II-s10i]|uniref:Hint domain-containing protein n=1 Tax=Oceanicola sp. 22II-s10i TaxID=1317116 RepID=UPI000B5281EA|nr:Hint domain-containing protein [Oceanicola sp. 22II-s10i]